MDKAFKILFKSIPVIIFCSSCFSGCYVYRNGPYLDFKKPAYTRPLPPIYLNVRSINMKASKALQNEMQTAFTDAGYLIAKSQSEKTVNVDLLIYSTFHNEKIALPLSMISGFTLTLIPGYLGTYRRHYDALIQYPDGTQQKVYLYYSNSDFLHLLFIIIGNSEDYHNKKYDASTNELNLALMHTMEKNHFTARSIPDEKKLRDIRLKDGRRFKNVYLIKSGRRWTIIKRNGEKTEITENDIHSIKPEEYRSEPVRTEETELI